MAHMQSPCSLQGLCLALLLYLIIGDGGELIGNWFLFCFYRVRLILGLTGHFAGEVDLRGVWLPFTSGSGR